MAITIKNEQDIEKMRIAGKLASEVLDYITPHVVPGITTGELDKLCHDYMVNVQKRFQRLLIMLRQAIHLTPNPFAHQSIIKFVTVYLVKKYSKTAISLI